MDFLKDIITNLNGPLKALGFKKTGREYYLEGAESSGLFNFQKSQTSTANSVFFTVNFGIYSKTLGRLIDGNDDNFKPKVGDCHWSDRVGAFMPGSPDHWWNVNNKQDIEKQTNEVLNSIRNIVYPELVKRLSEDKLINEWINSNYAGTSEFLRFVYLTTLLKWAGDLDRLNTVIKNFLLVSKGRPNEAKAKKHINDLDI